MPVDLARSRGRAKRDYPSPIRLLLDATRSRLMALVSVSEETGCWEWQGFKNANGYGRFSVGGANVAAHRAAYELYVGLIPEGLDVDHLCRNRACINPSHLEAVSHEVNVQRGAAAQIRTTHCPRGHPKEGENLLLDAKGHRHCRECRRRERREWWGRTHQVRKPRSAALVDLANQIAQAAA